MAKIKGFAEWLPQDQILQDEIISTIKDNFALHGFSPLITRSIEPLEELLDQGETDKEIYAVTRLGSDAEPELGLHYDLTVPFARYVSENAGQISFPYRRYQIQPAWRGERPQLGRFREFIQADADVVDRGSLEVRHDAELLAMFADTLEKLPIPEVKMLVNNRKLLQGFYEALEVADIVSTLRILDKLPKVGSDTTAESLTEIGLSQSQVEAILGLAGLEVSSSAELSKIADLGVTGELLDLGIQELGEVLDTANSIIGRPGVVGALHIARGFDYYTGTVAESALVDYPEMGSVCSGGRYDNLVVGGKEKIPGVGFSIGVSRLIAYGLKFGIFESSRISAADVLIAVNSEQTRDASNAVAKQLRDRSIACLVSDTDQPFGKQIKAAEKAGCRYVIFIAEDGGIEARDLDLRTQDSIELDSWSPSGV